MNKKEPAFIELTKKVSWNAKTWSSASDHVRPKVVSAKIVANTV